MNNKTSFTFKRLKLLIPGAAVLLLSLLFGGCANVTSTPIPTIQVPTPTQTSIVPEPNHVRITKYPDNYTAFKIEMQGGATIISDPYMMDEKVSADIVTESHPHLDHTDTSQILKPFQLIDQPGSFELAGVKIIGIVGAHNKTDPDIRPGMNIAQENKNTIYVFDLGDIRIAQFASQGRFPSPEMFAQIGTVDVLIIQIYNAAHKLSVEEAQEIATKLSARIIIPAHGKPQLNQEFAKQLGAEFKEEPSGILNLTRSDLDNIKTPIVMVLDHP